MSAISTSMINKVKDIGGKKTVEMTVLFFDVKLCLSCLRVTKLGLLA